LRGVERRRSAIKNKTNHTKKDKNKKDVFIPCNTAADWGASNSKDTASSPHTSGANTVRAE
jgi:hypothetical protein